MSLNVLIFSVSIFFFVLIIVSLLVILRKGKSSKASVVRDGMSKEKLEILEKEGLIFLSLLKDAQFIADFYFSNSAEILVSPYRLGIFFHKEFLSNEEITSVEFLIEEEFIDLIPAGESSNYIIELSRLGEEILDSYSLQLPSMLVSSKDSGFESIRKAIERYGMFDSVEKL